MNEIIAYISSVGFPIVACVGLFGFIQKDLRMVTEAVKNNTQVIMAFLEHLKGGDRRPEIPNPVLEADDGSDLPKGGD